jgi:putative oxidoreductase
MKALMQTVDRLYGWFVKSADFLQAPLLLAIRLYWGWQFWLSGTGKLADISKVVEFFSSLGIPAPHFNAYFVAYLEAVGGILLILGLGSRLIALPLVVDMVVAFVTADREALGYIFSAESSDKFYKADPFTFLFISLIILAFGPGLLSVDTIVKRYRESKKKSGATSTA